MAIITYPFTLTAGQPENVNQLNSNLSAITTQTNGNIDATNMATTMKAVTLRGSYEFFRGATCGGPWGAVTAGTYAPLATGALAAVGANNSLAVPIFYFDPADHTISGLTTKLRLRLGLYTNSTAPTGTFTAGLYPVSSVGGTAGNQSFAVGAVTSGSTAAVATPALNTSNIATSTAFDAPTAGHFAFAFVSTATGAASSFIALTFELQKHYI